MATNPSINPCFLSANTPSGSSFGNGTNDTTRHGYSRKELLATALDSFHFKSKKGGWGKYLYTTPLDKDDPVRGSEYWAAHVHNNRDYYVFKEEVDLLKNPALGSYLKRELPARASIIDLGPGSEDAVEQKIHPVLRGLNTPERYVSVDISKHFAAAAANNVSNEFNDISSRFHVHDFLKNPIPLNEENASNPVMLLFGGLMANVSTTTSATLEQTERKIAAYLLRLRKSLPQTGYFLLTQDTNQDEDSLIRAYDTSELAQCVLSALHLIKSDLDTRNFHPENFEYRVHWHPEERRISLDAVSTKDQIFSIEGHLCTLKANEHVSINNAFKFDSTDLEHIAAQAGYNQTLQIRHENGKIALSIFRVEFLENTAFKQELERLTPSNSNKKLEAHRPGAAKPK